MSLQPCNICSYRQLHKDDIGPVYHDHFSSREFRIKQGLEWSESNLDYPCPTCQLPHSLRPETGLNICVTGRELHGYHQPVNPGVICPPDRVHVDWVSIPGEGIQALEEAWSLDFKRSKRPMRVLLVAGVDDILNGGSFETITNSIQSFKNAIDENNMYHTDTNNELVVATILNAPKSVWFPDAGLPPPGHPNKLQEVKRINDWIVEFNSGQQLLTPRFHRFGVKCGSYRHYGQNVYYTIHQRNQWKVEANAGEQSSELSDFWKIKLAGAVFNHFEGERSRKGVLG